VGFIGKDNDQENLDHDINEEP